MMNLRFLYSTTEGGLGCFVGCRLLDFISKATTSFTKIIKKVTISSRIMFRIQTIPVLKDNYTYLLIDAATQRCLAIDPVKPQNLIPHLSDLELKGILTTHHHWDHAGGNLELLNKNRSLLIYGSDERIP